MIILALSRKVPQRTCKVLFYICSICITAAQHFSYALYKNVLPLTTLITPYAVNKTSSKSIDGSNDNDKDRNFQPAKATSEISSLNSPWSFQFVDSFCIAHQNIQGLQGCAKHYYSDLFDTHHKIDYLQYAFNYTGSPSVLC